MPLGIMGDELRPLLINLRVAPQYLPYTTALMFEGFQEFLPIHAAEGCQSLGQLYDENSILRLFQDIAHIWDTKIHIFGRLFWSKYLKDSENLEYKID